MWLVTTKRFFIFTVASIFLASTLFYTITKDIFFRSEDSDLALGHKTKSYIAIVIDDFGNNGKGIEAMLELDLPLTAAVIPGLPHSKKDAEAAHKAGLEVILHVPMEPMVGNPNWLGPKGISCDLTNEEIKKRITEGLKEITWAKGMNNHMGSKATANMRVMKKVLEAATTQKRDLFFLDSRTTMSSVIRQATNELNITFFQRDVFLDNSKFQGDIEKQLIKLGDIALSKGYAIGIGHVGPEGGTVTAKAIESMYPILKKKGIEFVYLSQLNKTRKPKKVNE